ncbi:MAG TPA: hypothetical protein VH309_03060, partial [Elusimicrobiota bacterium]|nr:hypothetical protein [Elusimicrobiota bacterium]
MNLALAGLLVAAAVPSRAAMIEAVPSFEAAPTAALSGTLPALTAPAVFAAPALSAPPIAAALALAAALPAALAPAPAAAPAFAAAAAPALAPAPAASARDGSNHPSTEQAASDAGREFDGFSRGSFESSDGLPIAFKSRPGPSGKAPRVYSGGLALNESFDPLFARSAPPARPEYFLWTRGHRPTGWTPTHTLIDADARDLARMIVLAAKETGSAKVELALHSFGTLVFQRLVQLHAEPDVAAALRLLTGSRVVLLNATTHYEGSEKRAGRQFEQMGQATRQLVDGLNMMDQAAETWRAAASLNPFLGPAIQFWMDEYRVARGQLLALASQGATNMMRKDLSQRWDPAFDSIRRGFVAALEEDSRDHGWQESLLRRSSDMFRLEFTKRDAARIRRLHIHLDLLHSSGDQLLNWDSARILFERLGIPAPETAPA